MIDIASKVHDKFSIEMKVGFVTRRKQRMNDFSLAMWFFVPGSLDITSSTYPKNLFYSDVKSNIRLITPVFLLREIVDGPSIPFTNLQKSAAAIASNPTHTTIAEFEYQIKMFCNIVKSSLRDELIHIGQNRIESDLNGLCEGFIDNSDKICDAYCALRSVINTPTVSDEVMKMYLFGDEFLGDITDKYLLALLNLLEGKGKDEIRAKARKLYRKIGEHKEEMGYPAVQDGDSGHNTRYLHRFSVLKKYIEQVLYIRAPKKRDGVLVEQLYFSIAAGLAMLFATVVSFAFQKKFGSLTLPLFIALIISYMLKDRIKELMRYYFAHRIGSKYFDNKAKLIHKDTELGWLKEGVDFIPREKVPEAIMAVRNSSHLTEIESDENTEKVLLYRKSVHVDRVKLQENSEYSFTGINDIIRMNVTNFVKKMDNPVVPVSTLSGDGSVKTVDCDREYYINLVLQYQYDDTTEHKRFRVAVARDGIHSIEEVK